MTAQALAQPMPIDRAWRLDRMLTLRAARPLARLRRAAAGEHVAVPILSYHSVSDDVDDRLRPFRRTVTTPRTFARHLAQIADRGLRAVSLPTVVEDLARDGGHSLRDAIALTFDTGYEDFRSQAWPVLERYGFTATVFLSTPFVGGEFLDGRRCLRPAQVRQLAERGVHFGSHATSHVGLNEVIPATLCRELAESRRAIEDLTGRAVDLFSLPHHLPFKDMALMRRLGGLLSDCGYSAGVTAMIGRVTADCDVRFLPRLPVNDCDDPTLLAAKLEGHYDWLQNAQWARDRARAMLSRRHP